MRPETPETDALVASINSDAHDFAEMTWLARRLERERDEAREQNAKLRDIAERAVAGLEAKYKLHSGIQLGIRVELDQLKEGGK